MNLADSSLYRSIQNTQELYEGLLHDGIRILGATPRKSDWNVVADL